MHIPYSFYTIKRKKYQTKGSKITIEFAKEAMKPIISLKKKEDKKEDTRKAMQTKAPQIKGKMLEMWSSHGRRSVFLPMALVKTFKSNIDHWILISPHAKLTNTAAIVLE
jgi:hypothetical protein